ncbi:MAG: threonylcarbamoyl-AMP synthase [Desulfobacteraceae bacterium]|nr:threonylcarbamoyl-AMP synthase [Desulfobacteraceae bacterium]
MLVFLQHRYLQFQILCWPRSYQNIKKKWQQRLQKRLRILHSNATIIKVSSGNPVKEIDKETIKKAGKIIEQKGVIIFPAQYFYGIAADALDVDALQKVFDIKKRPLQNPLLALVKDRHQLETLVDSIPDIAEKLIKKYWPGNITIIFKAAKHVPDLITAKTGKIGLRMPWHPVAKAIVNAANRPVTGTSANISGKPACNSISTIDPDIINNADMTLDAGELKTGLGSTVVDVTEGSLKIIRQGQIPKSEILNIAS